MKNPTTPEMTKIAIFQFFKSFPSRIFKKYGRQNFLYQKAVLEGLCKLYFNKKIVCPNPSWAHAFVSGLCFCRTCLSYKNQVSFCRELFFVMQNHGHKSPHFVGDMLVKQKGVKWFLFCLGAHVVML